jgi:glycosyltransferase involved in cell wall biosynthesis
MNILQLTPKLPYPLHDGSAIAAWNLTRGLSVNGCTITILAMNTDKHYSPIENLPAAMKEICKWESVYLNTRISPLKAFVNLFFSKLPYNIERFNSRDYSNKLQQLLEQEKFDIIQCEGLPTLIYLPIMRKFSTARIAYRAHNIESEIWERKAGREHSPLKKFYYNIIAKRLLALEENLTNKYDLLVPITDRDAEVLRLMGNKKPVCVVPSGYNIEMIPEIQPPGEGISIGYIGSLDWTPNQEGLLWFLEKVWKPLIKHGNVKFHVAGRNAPPWLEKILQNTWDLIYEGEVEDSQTFMLNHPVLVVPLFSGSGMRVKIVEGMALGRIIISTPLGIEGLPVNDKKNILIAVDSKSFQEILTGIIADPEKYIAIGEAARSLIPEKFDNIELGKKLANFYSAHVK